MPGKLWPTLFGEKKVIQYIWRSARLEPKPAIAVGTILFFAVLLAAVIVSIFTLQNQPAELPVPSATVEGAVRIVEIPAAGQPGPVESVSVQTAPDTYRARQIENAAANLPTTPPISQKQSENSVPTNSETQTGKKEKTRILLLKDPAAEFGWQFNKTYQDWRFYPGVDLIADKAQIPAVAGGQVEDVINGGDFGLTVIVASDQYKIYYASLKSTLLRKGEKIAAGDPVGFANSGKEEAQYRFHLRVQSIATGKYINPLEILSI